MTYDSGNRLKSYNGIDIEYDDDGNMTKGILNGNLVDFTYDCRNRLVKVGNIEYEYDAENNRIAVIEDGKKTTFVNDTNSALSMVIMKIDNEQNVIRYVYGLGLLGEEEGEEYRVYHFDRRGSTIALTDMDGIVTDRYMYGTYGELLLHDGSSDIIFLYDGKDGVVTDNNGLYYMRARYYSPELKRFINADILVGSIGEGDSVNRYAYVNGNPVSFVDPFGLSPDADSVHNRDPLKSLIFGLGAIAVTSIAAILSGGSTLLLNIAYATAFGGLLGGSISGLSSVLNGGSFIDGFCDGLMWGALGGGIGSLTSVFAATLGAGTFLTTVVNVGTDVGMGMCECVYKGQDITLSSVVMSAVVSFVSYKFGSWLSEKLPSKKLDVAEGGSKTSKSGSKPIGATFEGTIYRSVNSAYDPLEMSQYTINSNHRYTESGIPGLYFSTGEKIVRAELGNYDVFDFSNRTMYSYDLKLTNMLDVSNPSVRSQLGISLDSIVGESYDVTHAIGRYAYNNGYNGIIAPSARADGGVNIILFSTKEI